MTNAPHRGASAPIPVVNLWRVSDHFAAALAAAGLGAPEIVADGVLHRFRTPDDRHGQRSGWFVLYVDERPAGAFGSWKTGATGSWSWESGDRLTPAERAELRDRVARAKRRSQDERERQYREAAIRASAIWQASVPTDANHPYLRRKAIEPHGARLDRRGCLVLPVGDGEHLSTLQFIAPDGNKRFLTGGRITGGWMEIQGDGDGGPLLIGEGFATLATLRQETGCRAIVAFNAGNLFSVARAIRRRHPHDDIILCGDDDRWTEGNPGRTKARAAALAIGAKLLMPDFTGLDLSTWPTDFNDLYRLRRACERSAS
ncbi:toprim domain-containing protein [Thiocystis violacea]|uniref:toprim domain-containing protein n=1 Tax=Thiocystis violacea TaxID=13725 RepID=UPI00190496CD|nr:toprim domain-containing protein [Thiocystis violacea]MBK1716669.1 hypothetical protein [Thiocystis violacea]